MDNLKIEEKLNRIEQLIFKNKKVLSFDEACEYTGLSRSYMYKLTSSRSIPYSKPKGKLLFFEKDKLDKWLLSNYVKTHEELEKEALSYTLKKKKA